MQLRACALLSFLFLAAGSHGASLAVVKSISDIYSNVALQAAEVRQVPEGRRVPLCTAEALPYHRYPTILSRALPFLVDLAIYCRAPCRACCPGSTTLTTAATALQVTVKAIQQQTGSQGLTLRDVPMDTLQFYIGRQHHIAVEVDGKQFEVVMNNQPDQAASSDTPQQQALPMPPVS